MKIFSFYLPYSLSKCLYISSLNSCHSLFSLDALSNQLDYSSIPQAYYFINMKTCTIFRNDMYIFLKLLYSSLSKWDSYSTDVIVNWKDIFYQVFDICCKILTPSFLVLFDRLLFSIFIVPNTTYCQYLRFILVHILGAEFSLIDSGL